MLGFYPLGSEAISELGDSIDCIPVTDSIALTSISLSLDFGIITQAGSLDLVGTSSPLAITVTLIEGSLDLTGTSSVLDLSLIPVEGSLSLVGTSSVLDLSLIPQAGSLDLIGNLPPLDTTVSSLTGALTLASDPALSSLNTDIAPATGMLRQTTGYGDGGYGDGGYGGSGQLVFLDFGIITSTGSLDFTAIVPDVQLNGIYIPCGMLDLTTEPPVVFVQEYLTPDTASLFIPEIAGSAFFGTVDLIQPLEGSIGIGIGWGEGGWGEGGWGGLELAYIFESNIIVVEEGSLQFTNYAPEVSLNGTYIPVGSLDLVGIEPSLFVQEYIQPITGSLNLVGNAPGSDAVQQEITPSTGSLSFTEIEGNLDLGIVTQVGSLTLSELSSEDIEGYVNTPSTASLSLAELTPAIFKQDYRQPSSGELTLSGESLTLDLAIRPTVGSLVLTGKQGTVSHPIVIQTNATSLLFVERVALAVQSSLVLADSGSLLATSNVPEIFRQDSVQPIIGSLDLTGNSVIRIEDIAIQPVVEELNLVEGIANTLQNIYLQPSTADLNLTGNTLSLFIENKDETLIGSLVITGSTPIIGRGILPSTGALSVVGISSKLGFEILSSAGSVDVIGNTSEFDFGLTPNTEDLIVTGELATTVQNNKITPNTETLDIQSTLALPIVSSVVTPDTSTIIVDTDLATVIQGVVCRPLTENVLLGSDASRLAFALLTQIGTLTLTEIASRLDYGIAPNTGSLQTTAYSANTFARNYLTPIIGRLTITGLTSIYGVTSQDTIGEIIPVQEEFIPGSLPDQANPATSRTIPISLSVPEEIEAYNIQFINDVVTPREPARLVVPREPVDLRTVTSNETASVPITPPRLVVAAGRIATHRVTGIVSTGDVREVERRVASSGNTPRIVLVKSNAVGSSIASNKLVVPAEINPKRKVV